ncbi:MAG TPA: tetratricopeptide repeat protein [Anaerolineae bacterium]|nr:tetratricopeptide repeat protein [Anaerolineae bacterium]
MDEFINWPPAWTMLLFMPGLLIGFTGHELAHALVAFLLGDTTQIKRLTFNPLRHISWLGLAVFLLFGFGWAKPVQVDPTRFRLKNPAWGLFWVSIAGATANFVIFVIAIVGLSGVMVLASLLTGADFGTLYAFFANPKPAMDVQGAVIALTTYVAQVNLILAVFNLLPVPMLDGFQAILSLYFAIRGKWPGGAEGGGPFRPTQTPPAQEEVLTPAQIHFNIGLDYHKAGQYDEAIARYRQALANDDQFALAYYNLGLAYLFKKRWSLAGSAFRAVLQSTWEPGLRSQAEQRLRELNRLEQDPTLDLPLPPPLEPDRAPDLAEGEDADPAMIRRMWLRLAVGAALTLILAAGAWLFVLGATIQAVL